MSRLIQGTTGLVFQGISRAYSEQQGETTTEVWQGESTEVDSEYSTLRAAGVQCYTEPVGGKKYRLHVVYTDGEGSTGSGNPDDYVTPTWSIHPTIEKVSVMKSPPIRARIQLLDKTAFENFATELAHAREGDYAYFASGGEFIPYTGDDIVLNSALLEVLMGEDIKEQLWWTLRKTRVCPRNTALQPDWTDIRKIWTTAQIITVESTIPANLGTLPSGDWLKLPGGSEQQTDGRSVIYTEWHYRESGGWDERIVITDMTRGTYDRKT